MGVGAELLATFDGPDAVGDRWKGLTGALAGYSVQALTRWTNDTPFNPTTRR